MLFAKPSQILKQLLLVALSYDAKLAMGALKTLSKIMSEEALSACGFLTMYTSLLKTVIAGGVDSEDFRFTPSLGGESVNMAISTVLNRHVFQKFDASK